MHFKNDNFGINVELLQIILALSEYVFYQKKPCLRNKCTHQFRLVKIIMQYALFTYDYQR